MILLKTKHVRETAALDFKPKRIKKQRPLPTLMLQLTLDRKSLLMVKLKPSGERAELEVS